MAPQPTSNWDPVLLISQESGNTMNPPNLFTPSFQIVSMQTLHYLTLCIFTPPLLNFFAEPTSLTYEGGASNVGMVMDWREMAGRPTVRGMHGGERWSSITWAWSEGKKVGFGLREDQWDGQIDPMRGWIIAFCWMVACSADIYYVYTLIRRPRLILDFALTLVFNHLVLTTYYSASIPTSLFFWLVLIGGSIFTVIVAEQLCVKREMSEGLKVSVQAGEEEIEGMELGALSTRDRIWYASWFPHTDPPLTPGLPQSTD